MPNDNFFTGKPALDRLFKCLERHIFVPRLPLKLNTEHPGGAGPILKPQLIEQSLQSFKVAQQRAPFGDASESNLVLPAGESPPPPPEPQLLHNPAPYTSSSRSALADPNMLWRLPCYCWFAICFRKIIFLLLDAEKFSRCHADDCVEKDLVG